MRSSILSIESIESILSIPSAERDPSFTPSSSFIIHHSSFAPLPPIPPSPPSPPLPLRYSNLSAAIGSIVAAR